MNTRTNNTTVGSLGGIHKIRSLVFGDKIPSTCNYIRKVRSENSITLSSTRIEKLKSSKAKSYCFKDLEQSTFHVKVTSENQSHRQSELLSKWINL